ncbi:MAG TPA: hypothetical protein VHE60_19650 [Pyrinomonadaceae bacterium]|nr:hypothetical protein [Pyrinomonadaceae bacterium]
MATSPLAVKRLNAIVRGRSRNRVIDVHKIVDREVGIERDAEQTALAG